LAGSVIGAGIFSLPFIFSKVGIVNGFIYLTIASAVVALSHLFYAEIILRSKTRHNFVGYSQRYLGKPGYWLAILMSVAQMLLVLVVYLILSQSFFNLVVNHSSFITLVIFWLVGSAAVLFSLRRLVKTESAIVASIIFIVFLIFLYAVPQLPMLEWSKLPLSVNGFLMAIGPLFFALGGRPAIVEMVRFTKKPKVIRKSIILGTIVPALAYALFALAIIALSPAVSEDAVTGLINNLAPWLLVVVGLLGLLSILSSYMVIGFDINDILRLDLRWKKSIRMALIIGGPIFLYLAGLQNFLWLVSFTGGVFGALTFIFIILMWLKATKRQSPLAFILLLFVTLIFIDQIARFAFNY